LPEFTTENFAYDPAVLHEEKYTKYQVSQATPSMEIYMAQIQLGKIGTTL
jgi:hypothetical protein